jgi:predicted nucleic acid-binding protein
MLYLDTSLLTAVLTSEDRSDRARAWIIAEQRPLMTSEWALTEIASAFSLKQRRGELSSGGRAVAERSLARLVDEALDVVPVVAVDFRRAADFVRPYERGLRGSEALHLAVARRLGGELRSLDERQTEIARELGIEAVVPVPRGSE